MDAKLSIIEPLIERVEQYSKTSFELIKLKATDKAADISSTLISRLLLTVTLLMSVLTFNTAVGLWVGELLGKIYYGFFAVTAFYALVGVVLYFAHPFIKFRLSNTIIKQLLN